MAATNRPVCRFFLQSTCIYGQNCFFSHQNPTSDSTTPSPSSSFTTTRFPHQLTSPTPTPTTTTASPSQQRIYCKYFLQGYCHRGASCWFLHELPIEEDARLIIDLERDTTASDTTSVRTLTTIVSSSSASSNSTTTSTSTVIAGPAKVHEPVHELESEVGSVFLDEVTEVVNEQVTEIVTEFEEFDNQPEFIEKQPLEETVEERQCAICFEVPATFGLLVSCDHVYCLECIREWRKNKSSGPSLASPFNSDRNPYRPVSPSGFSTTSSSAADLGPTKTCPLCRTPSPYIIPSSIYPATAQDKTVMNDRYKASLSRIPCRYFEQSNRNRRTCPFGDDCFFRHAEAVAPDVRVPVDRPPARLRGGRRVNRGGRGGGSRFLRFDDLYPDMQTDFDLMIDMAAETAYRATASWDFPDEPVSGEDELARMLEMMVLGEMVAAEAAVVERERNTQRAQRERESYEEWDGNGDVPSGRWVRMGDWGIYRAEPGARGGGSRGGRRRGRGRGRGPASVSYVVGRDQYEYGRVSNDEVYW